MTNPPVPETPLSGALVNRETTVRNHPLRPPTIPSLTAMGAVPRLALALVVAGLLWLAVAWALGWTPGWPPGWPPGWGLA